ncbi:hypothetical protein RhiirA4_485247 [Rhizophagus irregularis]|uniref:Uncharacterized protein n=1 Tax=Rhizophagus irregularis TaxID=588596 RepID=A0A2I1HPX5_9GLOM|nr:hypothetical protein RhiirA4_485247 [Rhizophagus irregularis]
MKFTELFIFSINRSISFINLPDTELTEHLGRTLKTLRNVSEGPSRRFGTDETSRKDPQDASELTKRPSRRFGTDETSRKNPQDALELTKRLGRNDPRLRYGIGPSAPIFGLGFGSVMELSALILDFRFGFFDRYNTDL